MSVSTGDSEDNVTVNRRRLVEALGGSVDRTLVGRLSHGNHVSVFRRDDTLPDEQVFRSDGVVSDVPGLFVLLTFADCVPLLFWDTARGVIGAAHAGWRGTALGIAPAVIQTMVEDFGSNPADVVVGIGPSIGPCCYAVCHDVLQAFDAAGQEPVVDEQDTRVRLDLWESNRRQLITRGVSARSIENPRICTSCQVDTYYSHRAEQGRTGRFALCAGLA